MKAHILRLVAVFVAGLGVGQLFTQPALNTCRKQLETSLEQTQQALDDAKQTKAAFDSLLTTTNRLIARQQK